MYNERTGRNFVEDFSTTSINTEDSESSRESDYKSDESSDNMTESDSDTDSELPEIEIEPVSVSEDED